ncbi:hypothetical protein [Candidatus Thioglobus sp. NP1]|uniref:hypothetical protein n=1 Tax=Candidatus Thioglobus sp. NP1 TaxID=2508687 RepID=UPI000DED3DA3|nr:hypothetical protein [Candidatus Thioglobus sp. NP1]AXE61431.1 hypothetical protein CRN91_01845 [Candidatus Thioglobus sp. NP1]
MNIKIRNTLGEIIGALIAMIWMLLHLTESAIMTIDSVSKVLAQGIGISIILIIALNVVMNMLFSMVTGKLEKDIDDERDKIFELYALQVSSAIFGITLVITLVLLGWFNLTINAGLIAITFSGFTASIVSLFLKVYLYK